MEKFKTDIVIVGAGPSGSFLAYKLAQYGFSVLLLDRAKYPRNKTCGDFLTIRARKTLNASGIDLPDETGYTIKFMKVNLSDRTSVVFGSDNEPWGLGSVLKRIKLDSIICNIAIKAGGKFIDETMVQGPLFDSFGQTVGIVGMYKNKLVNVFSRVVVLATGFGALPSKFGLKQSVPYMLAERAYFEGEFPEKISHVYFSRNTLPGYAWIFPLSSSVANIGLGYKKTSRKLSARNFLKDDLNFNKMVKDFNKVSNFEGAPLRTNFVRNQIIGNRVLTIGEAAGLVNPLTGGGISNSIESAQIASDVLTTALSNEKVPLEISLKTYENKLKKRFYLLFKRSELIRDRIFSSENQLYKIAVLLNYVPGIKKWLLIGIKEVR